MKDETAWTLYNAGYHTHRGSVLTVAHVKGATYRDAWSDAVLRPLVEGDRATLSITLGPRDVNCVIQQRPR